MGFAGGCRQNRLDLSQAVPFLVMWLEKYLIFWTLVNSSVNRNSPLLRKLQGSLCTAHPSEDLMNRTRSGVHWIKLWWRCCRALGEAGVRDPREQGCHLGVHPHGLARLGVTV